MLPGIYLPPSVIYNHQAQIRGCFIALKYKIASPHVKIFVPSQVRQNRSRTCMGCCPDIPVCAPVIVSTPPPPPAPVIILCPGAPPVPITVLLLILGDVIIMPGPACEALTAAAATEPPDMAVDDIMGLLEELPETT